MRAPNIVERASGSGSAGLDSYTFYFLGNMTQIHGTLWKHDSENGKKFVTGNHLK